VVKIITFSGALTDTSEHRETSVLLGNVVDKLHDKHGLADTSTSEETNLTSTSVWVNKVNNLDTSYKNLSLGLLLGERWGISVNWKSLGGVDWSTLINGLANNVDDTTEEAVSDWHLDWRAGVNDSLTTDQTVGCVHSNGTNGIFAKMLGNLEDKTDIVILNLKGVEDRRELAIELNVNNSTNDLSHATLAGSGGSHGAAGLEVVVSGHGGTTTKC
jgi:hypothetical protein